MPSSKNVNEGIRNFRIDQRLSIRELAIKVNEFLPKSQKKSTEDWLAYELNELSVPKNVIKSLGSAKDAPGWVNELLEIITK